ITGAEYDEQGWIVVSGVATNCGNIPGEFTVVPFWPEESYGRVITDQLPVYHVGATTHFRAVLTTDATRAEGICLMGAPARRMDCVTVAPGPDGTLVVGQPPAGSPAWTKRAYVWAEQSGCDPNDPNGICGSCVGVIGVDPQD
ncbi:MAG TPA: hypothetical protein VFT95_21725, partial [Micromonosporaceae bacterium]|nr:hypothetical protein [Micromonosporaceae bacterium]